MVNKRSSNYEEITHTLLQYFNIFISYSTVGIMVAYKERMGVNYTKSYSSFFDQTILNQ